MSTTAIANNAIALVGGERIGNLDDNTKSARLCKAALPVIVNQCLESALWGFATRTVSLAQLVDTPSDAVAAYQLPNDCVRIGYIDGQPYRTKMVSPWRVRGRTLLLFGGVPSESVTILYVSKDTPTTYYTPSFTVAIEILLAARLALAIPEAKTLYAALTTQGNTELARAASYDAVQGSSDYRKMGRLHQVRLSGVPGATGDV